MNDFHQALIGNEILFEEICLTLYVFYTNMFIENVLRLYRTGFLFLNHSCFST